jgi:hypothetical protein
MAGYPTLKWFPPGSSEGEDYVGGRSSQEMIRFVNSRSGLQARPKQRPNKVPTRSTPLIPTCIERSATQRRGAELRVVGCMVIRSELWMLLNYQRRWRMRQWTLWYRCEYPRDQLYANPSCFVPPFYGLLVRV